MTIREALDVFTRGFCVTKSVASPYVVRHEHGLWIMSDGPGRKRPPRKTEIATTGLDPSQVIATIRELQIGWHFLCHVHELGVDAGELRSAYKDQGYRSLGSEGLFVHDLKHIPIFSSDPAPKIVRDQQEANSIPRIAAQPNRVIPNTRLHICWDEQTDYGWVTSIPVESSSWVSGLYVHARFRNRGFGRSLMSALLQSDRENGIKQSVLLASAAGERLYPHLGYQKLGVLQMFCPVKRY